MVGAEEGGEKKPGWLGYPKALGLISVRPAERVGGRSGLLLLTCSQPHPAPPHLSLQRASVLLILCPPPHPLIPSLFPGADPTAA